MHVLEDRKSAISRVAAADVRSCRIDAPNRFSRKRQSIARLSFASACSVSTIWSRRALNRSFCPLSRRSLGRIESPSAKPTERQNHDKRPINEKSPMQPEREISESKRKKKKGNSLSFGFFCFLLVFGIGTFQRVMAEKSRKIFLILSDSRNGCDHQPFQIAAASPFPARSTPGGPVSANTNMYSEDF